MSASTTTLITAPLEARHLLTRSGDSPAEPIPAERSEPARNFKIESADSFIVRQSANVLLQERYGWRGYQKVSLPANQTSDRITLTAVEEDRTIGTITIGMSGAGGMSCEDIFSTELDDLRVKYPRVCEFTKLAIDPVAGTNRVLAALFHVAYIIAHRLRQFDALVMEVNPRHVRYYQRMLGGRTVCEPRMNNSVNAPAVLLVIDFAYVREQIAERAGKPCFTASDRSLYSLFFTTREEDGILNRLVDAQEPPTQMIN